MTYNEFLDTLQADQPPAELSDLLRALWYDGKGDWEGAHNVAQDIHTRNGSRIHAYLHRKEGDIFNARYWYNRADQPEFRGSLEQEWEQLVRAFLK